MTTLHTLNTSAREHPDLFARLLRCTSHGDALLLLENGVYNLSDTDFLTRVQAVEISLYALNPDIQARGLATLPHHAHIISDANFVTLVCQHEKTVSWFS
ncbi:MAG: sulfurtransferase complex subunit TusB [Pseudomonadales bacterium]|nr:sulfurtransferase complex subunit TusB [Pseudomonadales bacterium]